MRNDLAIISTTVFGCIHKLRVPKTFFIGQNTPLTIWSIKMSDAHKALAQFNKGENNGNIQTSKAVSG